MHARSAYGDLSFTMVPQIMYLIIPTLLSLICTKDVIDKKLTLDDNFDLKDYLSKHRDHDYFAVFATMAMADELLFPYKKPQVSLLLEKLVYDAREHAKTDLHMITSIKRVTFLRHFF